MTVIIMVTVFRPVLRYRIHLNMLNRHHMPLSPCVDVETESQVKVCEAKLPIISICTPTQRQDQTRRTKEPGVLEPSRSCPGRP